MLPPTTPQGRWIYYPSLLGAGSHGTSVGAIDLLRSYELALVNDGQLKAARGRADAGREVLPQASAQLYPNVALGYSYGRAARDRSVDNLSAPRKYYPSRSGSVTLRQPILRSQLFSQYQEAKSKVEAVDAQLDTDFQRLGVRVVTTYFDALFARDSLALIGAQKTTYEAQLRAAKLSFAAGSGTRTDIDEIQARYDLLLAEEIRAQQAIGATTEQLEIYVGERIGSLSPLDPARFDAEAHDPVALERWVSPALDYNPDLRALKARYETAVAAIETAKGGHYPTLDVILQYSENLSESTNVPPAPRPILPTPGSSSTFRSTRVGT